MNADRKELLESTFTTVLEQFAFMFAEPAGKEEFPTDRDRYVQATLRFVGPMTGQLVLAVPEEECVVYAANILGTDPDDGEAQDDAADSFKELVNVTTGQVLTALAGEEVVFDLSVPELGELTPGQWTELLHDPDTFPFLVDDSPLLFCLKIDD
ncbi:hypothetical protein GF373_14600 [bacterium]|nr:hypothetical protein [bacterium]